METWAAEEFAAAELGDNRLNKRLIKLAERFADKPTSSIPGACDGWAETQAAYRFLSHPRLDWEAVLSGHVQQAEARMRQHPVVLCVQDTTELDFNGQQMTGLGPLSYEAQRGMYLHPTLVVTPQREPLGVTDAWMWAREHKAPDGHRPGMKESLRWTEGYERVAEMAARMPQTRLVYVADRESDIMALMRRADALGCPADWLIRSKHNRTLPEGGKLWNTVLASAVLGEIQFTLPARRGQPAREVCQQLRAERVTFANGRNRSFAVTCIVARETAASAGSAKPVEWRLLTNRTLDSFETVVSMIDWYRARWEIETFFDVLKNVCKVEALQLSAVDRTELALAVFMVVSWRLMRLKQFGRIHPDLEVSLLFEPEEWQAAFILAKKPLPPHPPTAREMIRQIAMLGGFLGRKCDGEPGVRTLWQGMQRVRDFVRGLEYAKSTSYCK